MKAKRRIGMKVHCSLCGGDGYVSVETAAMGGRSHGDTTCPECDGEGKAPWTPLCKVPACMGLARCDVCLKCGTHCECKRKYFVESSQSC